jgi:hypothetical protein
MKPDELAFAARVEEMNPTDRVRGTVVNLVSGMFVVQYDNGDFLAFQNEQAEGFKAIPHEPIPEHAMRVIKHLYLIHGRTPPEDVVPETTIPGQKTTSPPIGEKSGKPALTRRSEPPTIEA